MRARIINILPHPPAYEYVIGDERPDIYWEQAKGTWVGLYRGDWPDLLGNELLKITNEFGYEVWRPDLRADRVYSYTFENGLTHRIFPAEREKKIFGIKAGWEIYSPHLLENLEQNLKDKVILHLNGLGNLLNQEILRLTARIPKVIQFHSQVSHPYQEFRKIRKNILSNLWHYRQYRELQKHNYIIFVFNNSKDVHTLEKYQPVGLERLFLGCDFGYWKPGNRTQAKRGFQIAPDTKVLSVASRLFDLKQVDRLIELLTAIEKKDDFKYKLIIAGHGNASYEHYLKALGQELQSKNRLFFSGFLNNEELLELYRATDLFLSVSKVEGGPVSVIKALACETPVMVTRVGGVDDFLSEHGCGILVSPFDYHEWKTQIELFLRGESTINKCDRNHARKFFHSPIITKKFLDIYENLERLIK